jgi:hypothetical protein
MAATDIIPLRDDYIVVYTDSKKATYLFSAFGNPKSYITINDGLAFNSYATLETYNAEMVSLGQPTLAVDPFGFQPESGE